MLFALAACMVGTMQEPQLPIKTTTPLAPETREQKNARMDWWRDARFGMFIHWGLYSIPAGEWMGSDGYGEWIRDSAHIPLEAYDRFMPQFNPHKFDAKKWVRIAKDAGMKYIVITTKHHDGFALYDSNVSDFDIMASPFRRDALKELAAECEREGLILCFYHSIMDWHHPDYLPRRPWEVANRPATGADMDRYVRYLHKQVSELLTNYGPIGIVWFDGEWESTWNHEYGQALYNLCRTLQPNTIVNNRVDIGRGGMGGMSDASYAGDYGTPEQEIPAKGMRGIDWETCMTMNTHWGYNRNDTKYKSTRELLRNLVDIASKGGNYLLNVGPDSLGEIPPESVRRLQEIGDWMATNGESIYGTTASLFSDLPWGRCTVKRGEKETTLYLHVFDWPKNGRLVVPGLGSNPERISLIGETSLKGATHDSGLVIDVPQSPPHPDVSVISLDFNGDPVIYENPVLEEIPDQFVRPPAVRVTTNPGITVRYTLDGSPPTAASSAVAGSVQLPDSETVTLCVRAFHGGKPVAGTVSRTFRRVTPIPAVTPLAETNPGLGAKAFSGNWDRLPDFTGMPAAAGAILNTLQKWPIEKEYIGARAEGYIQVPSDDMYLFELTSDDGSKLWIDDKLVVDNDGLHSPEAKTGFIALAAGPHRIRIDWFNKTGAVALRLRVATPGTDYEDVPAAWLRR